MTPEIRARVLAEWRGAFEPKPKAERMRAASEVIEPFLRQLGLTERLNEEQVLAAWSELVGEFLAKHSQPSRLRDGVLYVQVLQPTVHYELDRVWKPQVLKKLKQRFGAKMIRDLRFSVG